MIEVRRFGSLEEAAFLRDEVNALNRAGARPDPFSTFEFYENYLRYDEYFPRGRGLRLWFLAAFREEMNSLTLTPANFRVTGPAGAVSGKVTYLGGTAVFTPTNGLASNTTYTATITAGATDLAGNPSLPMAWSFATGASADVAAPAVISTNPAGAESGVAISRTINVSFNEPMDPATITTANFRVTGPGATPVIGTVAFDATSNTATFTRINHLTTPVDFHPDPVSNLDPATTYTVTLTTGARDMAGNALASNRVWSFTTTP